MRRRMFAFLVAVLFLLVVQFACMPSGASRAPATVSGHVRNTSNNPIGNAWLSISYTDGSNYQTTQTDSSGYYLFTNRAPGENKLFVNATGYGSKTVFINLGDGASMTVDVQLNTSGVLRGTVRDSNMNAIASAHISATSGTSYASGYSDGAGNYNIASGLDNGLYSVMVSRPGYISSFVQNVSISSGSTTVQDLILVPSATLQGYVYDDEGVPVANATVRALNETLEHGFAMAFTNATGFYKMDGTTIGGLETGVYMVYGESNGYITRFYPGVIITTGSVNTMNLVLNRSVQFVGHVTNAYGAPVSDAIVSFASEESESAGQSLTDATGAYSVCKNLVAGTYSITVRAIGYPIYTRTGIVASTGQVVIIDVQLGATGSITGIVKNLSNSPVENVFVKAVSVASAASSSATTSSDGSYTLVGLPAGSYDVTFNAQPLGYQTVTLENQLVTGGNVTWLNITLSKPTFAIGRVLAEDGRAVEAYVNMSGEQSYSVVSDSDGRFNITVLPGTYAITVEAQDYIFASDGSFVVFEGEANVHNFTMIPFLRLLSPIDGEKLSNHTALISGTTVAGASVTISVNGEVRDSTTALGTGAFSASVVLATGTSTITVYARDGSTGQYSTKSASVSYTLPTVSIRSPANDATINVSRILIKGNAADSSGGENILVYVKIDDGNWELVDGKSSWSKLWLVTSADNGGHVVQAKAFESESLVAVASVQFTIELPIDIMGIVVIPPTNETGIPGENIAYRFHVRNTGTFTDSFDISASSDDGWAITLSQDALENLPKLSGQKDVIVTLSIPSSASVGKTSGLTFTVTSRSNPDSKASVAVTTTVKENVVPGALPPYLLPLAIVVVVVIALVGVVAYRSYMKSVEAEKDSENKRQW